MPRPGGGLGCTRGPGRLRLQPRGNARIARMRAERPSDGVVRTPGPVRARVLAVLAVVLVAALGIAGFIALRPERAPSAGLVDQTRPQDDRGALEAPASPPLGRAVLKALPTPELEPEPEPEE